jgi:TPR repeat protein
MMVNGRGGLASPAAAKKLFEKAAANGHSGAMFDSVADAASPSASDLPALITQVQEAGLHPRQETVLHPKQSAPTDWKAKSSGSPALQAFGSAAFKRSPLDGTNAGAVATGGPKIISVQDAHSDDADQPFLRIPISHSDRSRS